jgi:hypothetical protein
MDEEIADRLRSGDTDGSQEEVSVRLVERGPRMRRAKWF